MTMPTHPAYPEFGHPQMKKSGRIDFRVQEYDKVIENKGYLLAWERASICPCRPVSTQTEQPDPSCPLCKGGGWYYFGGDTPTDPEKIGVLDEVQKLLISHNNAMVIRGVISSIQATLNPWDKLGNWMAGTMQVTVRAHNYLAYYDKLISLDSEIVYSELVIYKGGNELTLRYLATGINQIRSQTKAFMPDADYYLDQGKVKFYPGKAPGVSTRLGIHYLCHPTWLVVEYPHLLRGTLKALKQKHPTTTEGTLMLLPNQALIRYDFLPGP